MPVLVLVLVLIVLEGTIEEVRVMKKPASPAPVVETPTVGEIGQKTRDELRAVIERIGKRNRDMDPDEIYREVTKVVEEVRQEQYEAAQRAKAHGAH